MFKRFDALGERLLCAGVSRAAVRRYLRELDDHLEDLRAEEEAAGSAREDAAARALGRLGGADALFEAMVSKTQLRAWCVRAPLLAFLLTPLLATALSLVGAILILMLVVKTLASPGADPSPPPEWFGGFAKTVTLATTDIIPLLIGWGLAATAFRQRLHWPWPLVGMGAVAVLGLAVRLEVVMPTRSGGHGELSLRAGIGSSAGSLAHAVLHGAVLFLAVAGPYLACRRWLAPR